MQILDYDNNNNVHVCLNCDTEFNVNIYNTDGDELQVAFCPCCGSSLDDEDSIDEIDEFLDDQENE